MLWRFFTKVCLSKVWDLDVGIDMFEALVDGCRQGNVIPLLRHSAGELLITPWSVSCRGVQRRVILEGSHVDRCCSLPATFLLPHCSGCVRRPFWLSPRQAMVVPVAQRYIEYAVDVKVQGNYQNCFLTCLILMRGQRS